MSPNPDGFSKRAVRGRARDILQAARQYKSGDLEAFYQTLTVSTFRNSQLSVSLANPALPDCPLVGVSDGFELMTGYGRSEVLGRNSRFLNRGCPMPADVRHELRLATRTRRRFVNVLVNRRRNGEVFMNLLHLSSLRVSNCMYLLAVQADVTNSDVDVHAAEQIDELERIVSRIFASSVDVWAAQQVSNFNLSRLGTSLSYTETRLCSEYQAQQWAEARNIFVMLLPSEAGYCTQLSYANTFIEVCSDAGPGTLLTRLRRVFSEPDLGLLGRSRTLNGEAQSGEVLESVQILPASVLRDALQHLPPHNNAPWSPWVVKETNHSNLAGNRVSDQLVREASEAAAEAGGNTATEGEEGSMGLKSVGSSLHPDQCKPCSFFCYSFSGCSKGKACTYCHMGHPRRRNRRGKKKPKSTSSSSAGSSGTSQGSAHSCCTDLVQACPNPTNAMLMPLLDALELLAPLPYMAVPGPLTESGSLRDSAPGFNDHFEKKVEKGDDAPGGQPPSRQEILLSYSESTVVLVLGQWKQILPFVSGLSRPMVFGVSPPLPKGLALHTSSGVISGVVAQLTPSNGEVHTVTVTGRAGSASTVVHVLVLESYSDGGSACDSEQLNVNDVNVDDNPAFEEMSS